MNVLGLLAGGGAGLVAVPKMLSFAQEYLGVNIDAAKEALKEFRNNLQEAKKDEKTSWDAIKETISDVVAAAQTPVEEKPIEENTITGDQADASQSAEAGETKSTEATASDSLGVDTDEYVKTRLNYFESMAKLSVYQDKSKNSIDKKAMSMADMLYQADMTDGKLDGVKVLSEFGESAGKDMYLVQAYEQFLKEDDSKKSDKVLTEADRAGRDMRTRLLTELCGSIENGSEKQADQGMERS